MDSKQETATRDTNQQPSKIKMQWRQLKTKRLRTPKRNHHHHHHHHQQQQQHQQRHCNFDSTFKHETNYRNIVLRLPWGIEMNEGWSSRCCNNNNNTAILSDAEEQGKGKSPWRWRSFFATRQTDRPSCRFAPIIRLWEPIGEFLFIFVFVQIKRIYYFKTLHHITIIIFLNYIYIKVILTCHV